MVPAHTKEIDYNHSETLMIGLEQKRQHWFGIVKRINKNTKKGI
jgi:hypothetical protein